MSARGREQLAQALRTLNQISVAGDVDDAAAARAAEHLAELSDGLGAAVGPRPWWFGGGLPEGEVSDGWQRFNPVAPPLQLAFHGERLTGTVVLGVEFTGPPLRAHGGFAALALDHALGMFVFRRRGASYTTDLRMRYLAGTPLGVPLQLEAGETSHDGDRTEAWAELRADGRTTVRAEGTFQLQASAKSLTPSAPRSTS